MLATEHLAAVAAIVVAATALVVAARQWPGSWTTTAARILAAVLVSAEVGWWIYLATSGLSRSELATAFPLQLCDAAIFIAALALLLRHQLLVEVTYFWGLAGTLQALITPDLPQHFPSFPFFQYYVAHGAIVTAALFLVVGLRQWPRRNAVLRVIAITIAYVLLVGAVDAVTGANYMYLRSKPPTASLFDLMGPWPWYVAGAAVLGIALLFILEAPFHWLRHRTPPPTIQGIQG
ncbi:MAG TPA: TIGR02206 family membrane protein [Candidatus Dormibacteraeota bacterium]|nr:TIGR02206 family membrane protein [Candidatus Dormibacteraeota bacterium]